MEDIENLSPETTPENEEDIQIDSEDLNLNHEEELEDQVETEETQEDQAEKPGEEKPFLNVKYNKEDRALNEEEARILAQKGLNYDKVVERLQMLEQNPNLNYLNDLAARSNMTLDQLVGYWKEQEEAEQLNELVKNNIPEEYAKEMLESRKFREEMQKREYETAQESKKTQEFKEFLDTFKDVKPEDIPIEVWQKREEGIPLKYAFMEYQYSKVNSEKKILENNQKNRDKAPGLNTTNYGSGESSNKDSFLEGFNED